MIATQANCMLVFL